MWEPRDLWVGVYLHPEDFGHLVIWRIYICLLPCLPIRVTWWHYRKVQP